MGNWSEPLLSEIVMMRGKELPEITAIGIIKIFMDCGEPMARQVISRLYGYANLPSNIIGEIKKIIIEINSQNRESESWKERNYKDANFGNNREIAELMEFNKELEIWHRENLVQKQISEMTEPVNIDEWIRSGRPKSWSPILDHWMIGFEKAYKIDLQNEGYLLDFLIQYNKLLKEKRLKKEIKYEN